MKRTIGFTLVALSAILLFAGCDQVLETFYPQFKEKYTSQQNAGITVKVSVSFELYNNTSLGLFSESTPIRVKLVPFYETGGQYYIDFDSVRENEIRKSALNVNAGYSSSVVFGNLYNALWAAFVYIDKNNDNAIENDEISALATIDGTSGTDKADFRYQISAVAMSSTLGKNSRIDAWILEQLQGSGGGSGTNQPPVANIESFPPSAPLNQSVGFNAQSSYDPDGYVTEWHWTIRDGSSIVVGSYVKTNDSHLDFTFTYPSNYTVQLKVKDNQGMMSLDPPATVTVYAQSSYVERRIHITGSNNPLYSGYPVYFALHTTTYDAYSLNFMRNAKFDTSISPFDNMFSNVPPGEWFVIGWVDLNWDGKADSNEPGVVATNSSQPSQQAWVPSLSAYRNSVFFDTSGTTTYVEVVVNIGVTNDLPSEFEY